MKLQGTGNQGGVTHLFDASGTLTGTAPVLVLPTASFRSFLSIQNVGTSIMYVDFGYARAGAVTMSGTFPNLSVASVAVANAGQQYSYPPQISFYGGGNNTNTAYPGVPLPEEIDPTTVAKAHCVMTGTAPNMSVASIVVDNGGASYLSAPLAFIRNRTQDPNGCIATVPGGPGVYALPVGTAALAFNGTVCPTDPVVIVGSSGGIYSVKYMT